MRTTTRAVLPVLAAALLGGGCDAPTEPTELEVTLTASPDPALPQASTGVTYTVDNGDDPDTIVTYPWKTSFTVSLRETGGLAVDITAVNVTVKQASGGIVITPSGGQTEKYQFNSSASGNKLSANGSATVGFEVWYDLPNKGREALVTVSFAFKDEDANAYSDSVDVRVSP
jgi:hypothetical protein